MVKPPDWALRPFVSLFEYNTQLTDYFNLAVFGAQSVVLFHDLLPEKVAQLSLSHEVESRFLARSRDLVDLAMREYEEGFSALFHFPIAQMWDSLEGTVERYFLEWLANESGAFNVPAVARHATRYASLPPHERNEEIYDNLRREAGQHAGRGVRRYVWLLGLSGVAIQIAPRHLQYLDELRVVRNVIVHNGGLADQELIDEAPHLRYRVGQPFRFNDVRHMRYTRAVAGFGRAVSTGLKQKYR